MVMKQPMIRNAIQRHIQDVLGVSLELRPWDRAKALPTYLGDRYEFLAGNLLGSPCVLAVARVPHGADRVRKDFQAIREHAAAGTVFVYVTDALASYERRRLVELHIPFLVPGNQLYLPDLGVDLREHFRQQRQPKEEALSPASQAVLIRALLRPWQDAIHPAALASPLGYGAMTATRIAAEWQAAGLVEPQERGRERWLRFLQGPRETWQQAQGALRTPVRNTHWAAGTSRVSQQAPLAGLSALAAATALAAPAQPVRALTQAQWKLALDSGLERVQARDSHVAEYQVWRYEPALLDDQATVDPLSLILSLREEADERVAQAIEQLEGELPW